MAHDRTTPTGAPGRARPINPTPYSPLNLPAFTAPQVGTGFSSLPGPVGVPPGPPNNAANPFLTPPGMASGNPFLMDPRSRGLLRGMGGKPGLL